MQALILWQVSFAVGDGIQTCAAVFRGTCIKPRSGLFGGPLMSIGSLRRLALKGIEDVDVKVSEIALVPSGHGETMNACRGGDHGVLTQSLGTAVH